MDRFVRCFPSFGSEYRAKRHGRMLRRRDWHQSFASPASSLSRKDQQTRNLELHFAIIGRGETARSHGSMLEALPGVSAVCAADVDRAGTETATRASSASIWTADARMALRRPDLDAVIIATPHASHADLACEALERGLHVFLEAPLALRHPDALKVLACARASDTLLAVNFWGRALPEVRRIRGRIPRPTAVRIEMVVDPLHDSWTGKAEHGGVLGLLGSHALDLACFLMRSRPICVQAMGGRHTRRSDLADTIAAAIRFANGGVARVIVGEYGLSLTGSPWRLWATDGTVSATAHSDVQTGATSLSGRSNTAEPCISGDTRAAQLESLRAFVDAVARGGEPLAGAEDGVRAVALADAVYEAMAARRRVQLDAPPLQVASGPIYADDSVANRRHRGFRA